MADKSEAIIRLAAKSCLNNCLGSDSPMLTLDGYLSTLEADGWDHDARSKVEAQVLSELMRMLQNEFDSDGGTRRTGN